MTISEEAKLSKISAYITALKKLCDHPQENIGSSMLRLLLETSTQPLSFDLLESSSLAQTKVEESKWMPTIHKTYHREITMPTHHVEQLWRDYGNFENSGERWRRIPPEKRQLW